MNIDKKKLTKRLLKNTLPKQYPLLNLYILIAIIFQVISQYFNTFTIFIKPLPVILMILYVHFKNYTREHLVPGLVEKSLLLSLIGDILRMINQNQSYTIAIVFYILAHLSNSLAFKIGDKIRKKSFQTKVIIYTGIIAIVGSCCLNIMMLWDTTSNKPLFIAHSLSIAIMIIFALLRYDYTSKYSYYFIIIGSFLFGFSDNMGIYIKLNNINTNFISFLLMLSYYVGHFFIMHGSLHHSNLQHLISQALKKD